ncbi:MAG: twin-arginine translocase TatA/TatE family subunit [Pseudolysinimonas sp.]
MLGNAFGWPHLLLILAVVLLVFGAARLPALAKSVGQSMKIFRKEIKVDPSDADAADAPDAGDPASASEAAEPREVHAIAAGSSEKP